ncbi:hypothetical protein HDU79_000784 [Rhizoclosmatium sp. JEL0117]|nr:hypothetical protein HDU79_000784 [Rhizoclosmatium sp. JEL0117]
MADDEPTVKFIRKRKAPSSTAASTTAKQRTKVETATTHSDDEGATVVRGATRKANGLAVASNPNANSVKAADFSFAASGTAASLVVDTATRTIDVDGSAETRPEPDSVAADTSNPEAYKGIGAYKEYVNKKVGKVTQSNAGGLRAGPLKGQTHVRISARFDYQQDICKDYKDSGNCGFGDSCIYMHDRGDYKTGWQLDKEWEEQQKQKKQEEDYARFLIQEGKTVEEEEEDDVPTDCPVCHGPFKDPVVTKCKHYFCESCALSKSLSKCYECNQPTGGSFAVAKELKVKLAEKKKKIAEKEEAIRKKVAEQMGEDPDAERLEDEEEDE